MELGNESKRKNEGVKLRFKALEKKVALMNYEINIKSVKIVNLRTQLLRKAQETRESFPLQRFSYKQLTVVVFKMKKKTHVVIRTLMAETRTKTVKK